MEPSTSTATKRRNEDADNNSSKSKILMVENQHWVNITSKPFEAINLIWYNMNIKDKIKMLAVINKESEFDVLLRLTKPTAFAVTSLGNDTNFAVFNDAIAMTITPFKDTSYDQIYRTYCGIVDISHDERYYLYPFEKFYDIDTTDYIEGKADTSKAIEVNNSYSVYEYTRMVIDGKMYDTYEEIKMPPVEITHCNCLVKTKIVFESSKRRNMKPKINHTFPNNDRPIINPSPSEYLLLSNYYADDIIYVKYLDNPLIENVIKF
uniref:Uncharacterized protein n=1 Tax=Spodoptera frugiperda nuclear polyhedrosis virus TaxID=10455 RepID=B2KWX7_NPVSF|nr:unknown [Spodoptera frugiperda multiple nucleopolyhedrovirus]QWS70850.1 hypothetical protein [Spodoptera frugiperda multiple nucleopolyhedrovirus]